MRTLVLFLAFWFGQHALAQPRSEDVSFDGAEGFKLQGTLLRPEANADDKRPAVLLLPGSGPTDRDGNQPPHLITDLLKQIAERLASEGVATLRFDKRAVAAYSPAWPKNLEDFSEFFSFEHFTDDADAAYRFLRSAPGIDPSHVFILGHSEGGLIALTLAAKLTDADQRPAGLILVGTAGRVGDLVIREQIDRALSPPAVDLSTRSSYLAHLDGAIAALKEDRELATDIPRDLLAALNPHCRKLLHAYFTIDPAEIAGKVRGPVLIVQGEKDAQVSAELDTPLLETALRSRSAPSPPAAAANTVEVHLIAEASHNLKLRRGDSDPATAGPVHPEALELLTRWTLKESGLPR